MPHIHTEPGQHDITVSAYIIRQDKGTWRCLVHMHKKLKVLMQVGGHVELDETPWQSMQHELAEEAGFDFAELQVLQHSAQTPQVTGAIVHPTPLFSNTHKVGADHFHSDYCYGFVATGAPSGTVSAGEPDDLRWCTIDELRSYATQGIALQDTTDIYRFLLGELNTYNRMPAADCALHKPQNGPLLDLRKLPPPPDSPPAPISHFSLVNEPTGSSPPDKVPSGSLPDDSGCGAIPA
jgi:8-oxo-dGTP pyrophosphatase MutT (NUDIX family)